jgi:dTDP-4-dehydrorhamnose 3,5-epimerase-like enzyme
MPKPIKTSLLNFVEFPTYGDSRGQLSVAQIGSSLPFEIRRVYWVHGTKPGVSRGFHAHKKLNQICLCMVGNVRMHVFDGKNYDSVILKPEHGGLEIPPNLWHEMHDFSPDCVLAVFTDAEYDESDYIRDRQKFIQYVHTL